MNTTAMRDVLAWRERKARLALATLVRAIAAKRADIARLESLVLTVEQRIETAVDARSGGVTRTVAALIDLEQEATSLRQERAKLHELQRQIGEVLDQLVVFQRMRARDWQRSETKLRHAAQIARRARIAEATREAEAEEQEHESRASWQ